MQKLFLRGNFLLMLKIPFWFFLLLSLLLLSAASIGVMDIDASQYAEMSREMMHSRNWLFLYDRGADYLDKPPLLFWLSATSMKLFGANDFGYKLPSILMAIWAIYATYRLAALLYDKRTGQIAALILGTCQGMFLMTNDIRTDTILMSWVITAIWMIKEAERARKWYYVLGGTASIALGMMTKGPIALFVPVFAFGADWALKRQWRNIFSKWHLLDFLLILLFLVPMSIGLYQQYDLHPEKIIHNKQGVSGLEFFFWTQSFGRITGENEWNNGAGPEFLLVNMLWSFLPWIFLLLPALFINVKELIGKKFRLQEREEFISTGGFILAYLSLCLSHYQLPHYIFVAFPLAAIATAKLLKDLLEKQQYPKLLKVMTPFMIVVSCLLFVGVLLILTITFPAGWIGITLWLIAVATAILLAKHADKTNRIIWVPAITMLLINIFLTHYFYRNLMDFQLGTFIGKYIREEKIAPAQVVVYHLEDPQNSLPFYAHGMSPSYGAGDTIIRPERGKYLLCQELGINQLKSQNIAFDTVLQRPFFKISELTPTFLSAKSRHKDTKEVFLLELK